MTFAEGQVIYRQSLVLMWHAIITSGRYRTMKIDGDGMETDEAKLKYCTEIMTSQCRLLGDAAQCLPSDPPAPVEHCAACGRQIIDKVSVYKAGKHYCAACFNWSSGPVVQPQIPEMP